MNNYEKSENLVFLFDYVEVINISLIAVHSENYLYSAVLLNLVIMFE